MKKHKIDQLFAAKLKNHKTPPADKVWGILEEELGETPGRRMGVWWKVAAVVLLCLSAGLWVYHEVDTNRKLMVQQEDPKVNTAEQPAQNETKRLEENRDETFRLPTSPDKTKSPLVAEQHNASPSPEKKQEKLHEQQDVTATQPKPSEGQTSETWVAEQPVRTVESIEPVANIAVEPEEEVTLENNDLPDKVTAVAVEVRKPVTIIYKANTNTKADEAETEKDSKFFEVVKDIKNGDLGLAELRDAKSDLIAAAFSKLKDKRDKQ